MPHVIGSVDTPILVGIWDDMADIAAAGGGLLWFDLGFLGSSLGAGLLL